MNVKSELPQTEASKKMETIEKQKSPHFNLMKKHLKVDMMDTLKNMVKTIIYLGS